MNTFFLLFVRYGNVEYVDERHRHRYEVCSCPYLFLFLFSKQLMLAIYVTSVVLLLYALLFGSSSGMSLENGTFCRLILI